MASALHQLIAQQQGPDIVGSAMRGLAASNQQNQLAQESELNRQRITLGQQQLAMATEQAAQKKREESLKLAANIASQIKKESDPARKTQIFMQARQAGPLMGVDTSWWPQQYDEQTQIGLDNAFNHIYGDEIVKADLGKKPEALPNDVREAQFMGFDLKTPEGRKGYADYVKSKQRTPSEAASEPPSAVKEYEYFKSLSPEDQDTYLKTKRGDRVTAGTEDKIYKTADAAEEQRIKAANYSDLANRYQQASEMPSGIRSNFSEWIKEQSGSQDAYTALRKDWASIKASQVVSNLPPGAASDADVKLALGGFLPDNANPKQVASFMRGVAKMSNMKAEYESFKSDYMSENKSTVGLNQAWKKYAKENDIGGATISSSQQDMGPKKIKSDDDYNALPSGAEFIAPDGSRRRKP